MKKTFKLWRLAAYDKSWFTLSNGLTLLRLLLAPVVVFLLYAHWWKSAVIFFGIAAGTDLLDGHLARAFNQQTHFGTMLDPIADKCLLVSAFGSLAFFQSPFFHIPVWFFCTVFLRELFVLSGAIYIFFCHKNIHIEPTFAGKVTTFLQILFLFWVFLCYFIGLKPEGSQLFFLTVLTIFSLASLCQYVKRTLLCRHDA